ncbi:c-type cytochrome [Xanthobacter sp. VTT E-85241]|uniref:c-type cytochrome n=1 Tax=Roseixanthobacter finlandensis TaxID=3119922 RepID=UPI00372C7163
MSGAAAPGRTARPRRGGAAFQVAALGALLWAPAAHAAPPGGSSCSGCHGAAGGAVPALAGRPAGEIVADMQAFRTGARPTTVMDRIAKGFTDEETRAIADWIAAGSRANAQP